MKKPLRLLTGTFSSFTLSIFALIPFAFSVSAQEEPASDMADPMAVYTGGELIAGNKGLGATFQFGVNRQVVEDQVTYPLTTAMLAVPGAETVRGYSFFGDSYVYIIFNDDTDMYWPSYYDGKVWTREEFEACGVVEYRYNSSLPQPLLKRDGDKYFYNIEGPTIIGSVSG